MEALANAVGLRMIGFGPGVLNVINGQVELVIMGFWFAAVFRATVSQNTDQPMPCSARKGSTRSLSRSHP